MGPPACHAPPDAGPPRDAFKAPHCLGPRGGLRLTVRMYLGDVPPIPVLLVALRDAGGDGTLQLLDGCLVAGRDHVASALAAARRARAADAAQAKDPGLELLRRAAGERQIQKALVFLGVKPGNARLVAAVPLAEGADTAADALAKRLNWRRDDTLLEAEAREGGVAALLDAWSVGEAERAVVPRARWKDLVLERVALTDAWK